MLETDSGVGLITVVEAGRTLASATAELKRNPNRITLVEFQTAHWGLNRFAMGLSKKDVAVDDCPETWTDSQIREFTRSDLGLFLPEVCSTAPEGLTLLGRAYPAMMWNEQDIASSVRNVDERDNAVNLFGWMMTENSIDAPFLGTDEITARAVIANQHRLAQTLNVYGEAGQESKLLADQFLDEVRTMVRVLSSRVAAGRVLGACFYPRGFCRADWHLWPLVVREDLGVRSVGV